MFKIKNKSLTAKLTGYFNSLTSSDVAQYERSFGIDLEQQKSTSIKYLKFGASLCVSDSNYLFSIGGVDPQRLVDSLSTDRPGDRDSATRVELRMDNVMFTSDSLYFLRSNNDPRVLTGSFVADNRLFVCGGVSVFGSRTDSINVDALTNAEGVVNLGELCRNGMSDRIEFYDFGLQDWAFHAQSLPFAACSLKALRINSHETVLFDGKILDAENKPVPNTKLVLYNCQSDAFSEWLDLRQLYNEEVGIQDVLVCKNAESSNLLVMISKNHSECAFELEADLFAFDLQTLRVRCLFSFSNRLVDQFNKKVFKPLLIQQNGNDLEITCRHLHMRNCLFKSSIPADLFCESIETETPLKFSQIGGDAPLGNNPILFQNPNKLKQSLFPLALSKINEAIRTAPDMLTIKAGSVFVYNLDRNTFCRRTVPAVLSGYLSHSQYLFINDDLVFICGGFKTTRVEGRLVKEPSRFSFIYSIVEDKWIAPICLRRESAESSSRVLFVNSSLLMMNTPKINHKIIMFEKSGRRPARSHQ